jgi:hypothetical protein
MSKARSEAQSEWSLDRIQEERAISKIQTQS